MGQTLRKILSLLTPEEKRTWSLLTLLDVVMSTTDILSLAALLWIVHLYTEGAQAIAAHATAVNAHGRLPDWLTNPDSLWPIGIFFCLFTIKNVLSFLVYSAQARFRYSVASRLSENNLLHYLEGNYNDYAYTNSAVHVLAICQHPIEYCQFLLAGIQQGITELTLIGAAVTAVLLFNAKLFLLLLILLLPPVMLISWLAKRRLHAARGFIKTSRDVMWQHLQESIASFVESNLYGKNGFFSSRYSSAQYTLNRHIASLQAMQGAPSRLAEVFAVFGLLALIAVGHFFPGAQHNAFVTLGAFLAAAYKIIPGVSRILNITGLMKSYAFVMKSLRPVPGHGPLAQLAVPAGGEQPANRIQRISMRHIRFRYDRQPILDDLSLDLHPGDFLGIDGRSGAGKTTLANILLGFVAPERGTVQVNGEESSPQERKRYWQRLAYVKQQPFVIDDSILTNICLDQRALDPTRLQSAMEISGLDEWVKTLPEGIQSRITENGKNVSGGQRQRISIARALYKDADLLLLDEPFSELDEASEERILLRLRHLAREGRIIVMITHNKQSLTHCNKVLSLEEETVCPYA